MANLPSSLREYPRPIPKFSRIESKTKQEPWARIPVATALVRRVACLLTVLGELVVITGLSAACIQTSEAQEPEVTGTVKSAIYGGHDDEDTREANTVVFISPSGCTGTLITPLVVLTASHCVARADCSTATEATVEIGADLFERYDSRNKRMATSIVARTNGCFEFSKEIGIDMALLFIDPATPVLDTSQDRTPVATRAVLGR